jgi:hypothetical protein
VEIFVVKVEEFAHANAIGSRGDYGPSDCGRNYRRCCRSLGGVATGANSLRQVPPVAILGLQFNAAVKSSMKFDTQASEATDRKSLWPLCPALSFPSSAR